MNGADSKYKRVVCNRWLLYGKCHAGSNCSFAHGIIELKCEPNPLHQHQQPQQQAGQRKKRTCFYYAQGHCYNGDECKFAHDVEQQQADISDDGLSGFGSMVAGLDGSNVSTSSALNYRHQTNGSMASRNTVTDAIEKKLKKEMAKGNNKKKSGKGDEEDGDGKLGKMIQQMVAKEMAKMKMTTTSWRKKKEAAAGTSEEEETD